MAVKSLKRSSVVSPSQVSNSANAGYSLQDFHHLETVQLGANAASVTFANLGKYSGDYKHLQIRMIARSTVSGAADGGTGIQINGDTGSNYSGHYLNGTSSSISSIPFISQSFIFSQIIFGSTAASGAFGASIIDFLDAYLITKNTTIRYLNGGGDCIRLGTGAWLNTSAITSIKIDCRDGNSYVAGSRFSLYGIK